MKIKSGDSLSTRYLNEYLFRFAPSIFQVIALNNAVELELAVEEEKLEVKVDGGETEEAVVSEFRASTSKVELSGHRSLNSC